VHLRGQTFLLWKEQEAIGERNRRNRCQDKYFDIDALPESAILRVRPVHAVAETELPGCPAIDRPVTLPADGCGLAATADRVEIGTRRQRARPRALVVRGAVLAAARSRIVPAHQFVPHSCAGGRFEAPRPPPRLLRLSPAGRLRTTSHRGGLITWAAGLR